ncbi:DUF3243 domain-containing protein [Paenibacillus aestuarii]|uniref:DUF3243 domain-containing protein n=1 Tax=Paenibacillus aestuarii TaxID=516965 RepID=A0ABW0K5W4_9BACL|nr:DUF3243 domain-containing protein [Paenibacillus aestuarii]
MSVLETFDKWKGFLSERVDQAQNTGMNNATINNLAYHVGDYLSTQVDPKNSQERVLKELWDVGNEEEQRALAGLMVKLVDKG